MYVLTSKTCLETTTAHYNILEQTSIRTALGNVILVEITKEGQILVAGPATKQQMISAVKVIQKYKPFKILIDGALYRKSIASRDVSDGIIFVTGASYSSDINIVVDTTKQIIDQYRKNNQNVPLKLYENIHENIITYNEKTDTIREFKVRLLNNEQKILEMIDKDITYIYIPGALTDRIAGVLIKHHNELKNLSIIIQDSSFVLLSPKQYTNLEKIGIQLHVLKPIKILFVAYNPTSPFNYSFDNLEFRALLRDKLEFEPVNILQDLR
jgi:hypothetical protein